MKKHFKILIAVILAILTVTGLCACSKGNSTDTTVNNSTTQSEASSDTLPTVLNTAEYVLYQNIFYNNQGDSYTGKAVTKEGTFTTLIDKYNGVNRYYIWGYNDQTKCCDWQWEINITDTASLPSNGSLVKVSGELAADESALDGYWIINPQITVEKEYEGPECDVDMTSMSATLERVQLINIQQFPDEFEGKSVYLYGRVASPTSIQHPYYDSVWSQEFSTTVTVPAIGKVVVVSGTYQSGIIADGTVKETSIY